MVAGAEKAVMASHDFTIVPHEASMILLEQNFQRPSESFKHNTVLLKMLHITVKKKLIKLLSALQQPMDDHTTLLQK